jgi:hypothetical protein
MSLLIRNTDTGEERTVGGSTSMPRGNWEIVEGRVSTPGEIHARWGDGLWSGPGEKRDRRRRHG